jgi:hypothetical protein
VISSGIKEGGITVIIIIIIIIINYYYYLYIGAGCVIGLSLLSLFDLRLGQIGCPETSVRNYNSNLPKSPKGADIMYTAAEA